MSITKGFLIHGPNGPRMSEAQLEFVTRGMVAAVGLFEKLDDARMITSALDAYTVDTSCWTCTHSRLSTRSDDMTCAKFDRQVPPEHREAVGCPAREDAR